jgi:hypothetical protein
MEAFKDCGVDPEYYAYRSRSMDEILPWDFIDIGVSKKYLQLEYERAKEGKLTKDCRIGCTGCGVNKFVQGGECFNGKNIS